MSLRSWSFALAVLVASPALAEAREPAEPAHHHHEQIGAQPKLNGGKKWNTDQSLRDGMVHIRDRVQAAMSTVHAGTYTASQYTALAEGIEQDIATVISQCRLPPDADANLHIILVQLWSGTGQMKKDGDRKGGFIKVVQGLESYATYFDHPGWKPVEH